MSRPALVALSLMLTTGCGRLADLRDKVAELTNDFVAEGLVTGVVPPDDPALAAALEGTELGSGAVASLFLNTLGTTANFGAPINDATVAAYGEGFDRAGLLGIGGGEYRATGEDGLLYVSGSEIELMVDEPGGRHWLRGTLPMAPMLNLPDTLAPGSVLPINAEGQGFDGLLITVVSILTGEVTFSSEPSTVHELYDITRGEAGVLALDLPASAFPTEGVYGVGVAGLLAADVENFEDVNPALTNLLAGQFHFKVICVATDTALCEIPAVPTE